MSQATIFMQYDDEVRGINVIDYHGDLLALLNDFYPTFDDADSLINMGCCAYLSETIEDSEFIELEDGSVEILEAEDEDEFVLQYGDTHNYQFDIESEEWVAV